VTFDWPDGIAAVSYQIHIDDSSTFAAPRQPEAMGRRVDV
jgi:hypothetical protein